MSLDSINSNVQKKPKDILYLAVQKTRKPLETRGAERRRVHAQIEITECGALLQNHRWGDIRTTVQILILQNHQLRNVTFGTGRFRTLTTEISNLGKMSKIVIYHEKLWLRQAIICI